MAKKPLFAGPTVTERLRKLWPVTAELIDRVERLVPTGEIGDGMVAQLHDLAARARKELGL